MGWIRSKIFSKKAFFTPLIAICFLCFAPGLFAQGLRAPILSARSAIVVDLGNGGILYSKNPHLKLPPASTAKVMTAILVLERLPLNKAVRVGLRPTQVAPSKAGLTAKAAYKVGDLLVATLVSSSNDAAVSLAEAVAGSEGAFVKLMNDKAKSLGMNDTRFVNATGLTDKRQPQYSTVYDLTKLMRYAAKDKRIDQILGIRTTTIRGSDGKAIFIRSHNKMLWRTPRFVKGKTGWTFASRHTFVGTDYAANKKIVFAFLSSKEPWMDIKRLATFGLLVKNRG